MTLFESINTMANSKARENQRISTDNYTFPDPLRFDDVQIQPVPITIPDFSPEKVLCEAVNIRLI